MFIKNIFRGKNKKALNDTPGHHNPCSYCWRVKCHNCLVFYLSDFSIVLRSDPKLAGDFEKVYNKMRGHKPSTRQERRAFDKGSRKMQKAHEKEKKSRLKVVD